MNGIWLIIWIIKQYPSNVEKNRQIVQYMNGVWLIIWIIKQYPSDVENMVSQRVSLIKRGHK